MPASAPVKLKPFAVTVLPVPTAAVVKVAVPPVKVTTSLPIALLKLRVLIVATVVPSYSLLDTVMDGVNTLTVISAVVVALFEDNE